MLNSVFLCFSISLDFEVEVLLSLYWHGYQFLSFTSFVF